MRSAMSRKGVSSTVPFLMILMTLPRSTTNRRVSPGGEVTKIGAVSPRATGSSPRLVPRTGVQELTAASAPPPPPPSSPPPPPSSPGLSPLPSSSPPQPAEATMAANRSERALQMSMSSSSGPGGDVEEPAFRAVHDVQLSGGVLPQTGHLHQLVVRIDVGGDVVRTVGQHPTLGLEREDPPGAGVGVEVGPDQIGIAAAAVDVAADDRGALL